MNDFYPYRVRAEARKRGESIPEPKLLCPCGWSGYRDDLVGGATDSRGRYICDPQFHDDDRCPECGLTVFDMEEVHDD